MAGNALRELGVATVVAALLSVFAATASADPLARTVARADAPVSELHLLRATTVPGGGLIHRYAQRVDGVRVFDAELVAVAIPGEASELISDSTVDGIDAPDTSGAISAAEAVDRASAVAGVERLRSEPDAKLGIDGADGGLVWRVVLPAWKPLGDFEVTLDADTGERLRVRDLLRHATGTANVFNPNPVTAQGFDYSGLKDRNDKDSPLLTSLRVPVTLERLDEARCLKGQYADSRLGRKGKKVCSSDADFSQATRSQGNFEAVMSYFHVDRTRAYVDSLGLSEPLRKKPQKVLNNAITDDNSFYSTTDHLIVFGTGGIDDAEDGDVIVHEYGHSLHDQAAPGFLSGGFQPSAIGEGFGDYMAAAMSALTTGGSPADACIFDWDGIPYSPTGTCGRTADTKMNLERAERRCGQDYYCFGGVYASTLLELRTALGNDSAGLSIMDRVVLEGNFMLSRKSTFKSAAKALIAADKLLYGGAHVAEIQAELTDRKFCRATC